MATSFVYVDIAEDGSLVETIETIEALQEYIEKFHNEFPVQFNTYVILSNEYTSASTTLDFPISVNEVAHQLVDLDEQASNIKAQNDALSAKTLHTIEAVSSLIKEHSNRPFTITQIDAENVYVLVEWSIDAEVPLRHGSFSLPVSQNTIGDILFD
jgi:hypothetical protein